MTFFKIITDALLFIPKFWGSFMEMFGNLPLPEAMRDFLDPTYADGLKFWVLVIIYIAIYLFAARYIYKLSVKLLTAANEHMAEYDFGFWFNKWFYIITIVLLVLDALMMRSAASSLVEEGRMNMTMIGGIGVLVFIVAAVRALIRTKLRFVYLFPMQMLLFVWVYFMILLWFPALVIVIIITALSSMGENRGPCAKCGYGYEMCKCPTGYVPKK